MITLTFVGGPPAVAPGAGGGCSPYWSATPRGSRPFPAARTLSACEELTERPGQEEPLLTVDGGLSQQFRAQPQVGPQPAPGAGRVGDLDAAGHQVGVAEVPDERVVTGHRRHLVPAGGHHVEDLAGPGGARPGRAGRR